MPLKEEATMEADEASPTTATAPPALRTSSTTPSDAVLASGSVLLCMEHVCTASQAPSTARIAPPCTDMAVVAIPSVAGVVEAATATVFCVKVELPTEHLEALMSIAPPPSAPAAEDEKVRELLWNVAYVTRTRELLVACTARAALCAKEVRDSVNALACTANTAGAAEVEDAEGEAGARRADREQPSSKTSEQLTKATKPSRSRGARADNDDDDDEDDDDDDEDDADASEDAERGRNLQF